MRPFVKFNGLNESMTIYTTRPHGRDGETSSYSMSLWMILLAQLLIWLNVVSWGIFGMVTLWRIW